MYVLQNNFIPKILGVRAIVLWPFVLFDKPISYPGYDVVFVHEMVHVKQIRENGVLGFYFRYLFDFLKNYIKYKDRYMAYINIPFEREAFSLQTNFFFYEEVMHDYGRVKYHGKKRV